MVNTISIKLNGYPCFLIILGKIKLNWIDTTKEYKYLGFLITPSFNLSNLKDRASRAFALIKTRLSERFRKATVTTIYLFDTLVKPILLYASDYWEYLKLPRKNPRDKQPMLESCWKWGGFLYVSTRKINCIKNWDRIAVQEKSNIIIKTSYDWVNLNNIGWTHSIKEYFSHIGLTNCFFVKKKKRELERS